MPTNGKLLDTNIIIALFASDIEVQAQLAEAGETFIPAIVFGELYYGARKSGRVETNVRRIDELLALSAVLDCDGETSQFYAITKNELRLKGKPIPENDIWIAALALQHDLTLITRDAHFGEVAGLTTVRW